MLSGTALTVDPQLTTGVLIWVLLGGALGAISGLIPGLHANNFALLLAGIAISVPGPPLLVGVGMLAAGVVHTFVNAIPAMALGVPDAEMAVTALPGHRMVLEGRGYEAIRLSAVGSLLAVILAVPLAIPVTMAVTAAYPTIRSHLSLLLLLVVLGLLASEYTWWRRLGGLISFLLATALGLLTLDVSPKAPLEAGGMLAPLFAGLFGAPVLIDAIRGGSVPPQTGHGLRMSRPLLVVTALGGAIAGAIVGYIPGVSAAIAAVAVLLLIPDSEAGVGTERSYVRGGSDRSYIVATSGVDTANMIFALFALVAIGQPRTGVMVAFQNIDAPLELPILVVGVVLAGALGFALVVTLGDAYLRLIGRLTYWKISVAVLSLLCVLSYLFTGPIGIAVFGVATVVGLVPIRFRARRVHLMGVLIGPLIIGF